MPRLSIVIPALGSIERLEATLVSVLEHRPQACELIVVLNQPYADPYQLGEEVRFIQTRRGAGFAVCAQLGLEECVAPVVHFLSSGVTVAEGWADAALSHFSDRKVAAIAPAEWLSANPFVMAPAAVEYQQGGVRSVAPKASQMRPLPILGPSLQAAFYRKSVLDAAGGIPQAVGDVLADVDIALALRSAGSIAYCEPGSRVWLGGAAPVTEGGFRHGFHAERLFWRNIATQGWLGSLTRHPAAVAQQSKARLPSLAAFTLLLGRLAGLCQFGDHARRGHQLRALRRAGQTITTAADGSFLRIDAGRPAPLRADQKASAAGGASRRASPQSPAA